MAIMVILVTEQIGFLEIGILKTFWNKAYKLLMKSANLVFSQIAAGEASNDNAGTWQSITALVRPDAEDNVGVFFHNPAKSSRR